MQNAISAGNSPTLIAPYAVANGGGALIGPGLFGVAATAVAMGARGAFSTTGIFRLNKAAEAVPNGAKLYWDNTAKTLTVSAAGNTYVAAAIAPAAAADPSVLARLNGVAI